MLKISFYFLFFLINILSINGTPGVMKMSILEHPSIDQTSDIANVSISTTESSYNNQVLKMPKIVHKTSTKNLHETIDAMKAPTNY